MLNKWLFKQVDNSALVVFRIFFGLIILAQSWGSILTGYIKERIIPAKFTFNFIGLDFIQPLPGNGMYLFFIVMGVFAIGVMIGYKYKFSMTMFTLMWAWVHFMSKTSYNNHYYLLLLLCVFMILTPANRYLSIDAKQNPEIRNISMPQWIPLFVILQMGIVYTFATVAKIYPDWLDGTVATNLMAAKEHYYIIGSLLQEKWVIWIITYFGILFDLCIVPFMLWKKTRQFAFWAAVFFHIFNSIVFQIGIFPYLAIALFIFFYPSKQIHSLFLRNRKAFYNQAEIIYPSTHKLLLPFLAIWFFIQLALPVRHWFIKGDVLWTEEGHRLAWRMMLRSRSGYSTFTVVDKATEKEEQINKRDYLTARQVSATATKPDMIWQFAQHLKKEYAKEGKDIEVYVRGRVTVNGNKSGTLIDPAVDLAAVKWNYWKHNEWILPYEEK